MSSNCPICNGGCQSRVINVRSGKEMSLFHCGSCNFDFFQEDPTGALAANKLDESRLKAAGLDIPAVEKDFENGVRQSAPYIKEYLSDTDRGRNILEIGCSWGYFLHLLRENGACPYGVELNKVRAEYVNERLGIRCFTDIEGCEAHGIKFKKIFLFYVLEYVPNPAAYLKRLLNLLDKDGSIVLITPNLADPLKDVWNNQAFGRFFYDECAINYFTPTAVRKLIGQLPARSSSVSTRQGYSFANQVGWYLNNGPRTTGMVGGDYYTQEIVDRLGASPTALGVQLAKHVREFDAEYRRIIERHEYGNQIRVVIGR